MYPPESTALSSHRANLLDIAVRLSEEKPFYSITRNQLAVEAGVAQGVVSAAFGGMEGFRQSLMYHAIDQRQLRLLASGIAAMHPVALAAPAELRQEALSAVHT